MLSGVPNFAFALGYTNASWTLKADLVSEYVCRLLNHMDAHGSDTCVPRRQRAAGRRASRCSTSSPATSCARSTSCPSRARRRRGSCARTTPLDLRRCATARSTTARCASRRRSASHRRSPPSAARRCGRGWRSSAPRACARRRRRGPRGGRADAVEDEVAEAQRGRGDGLPGGELGVGVARDRHAVRPVDELDQPRAVEAECRRAAPQVTDAEEPPRRGDDPLAGRGRRRQRHRARAVVVPSRRTVVLASTSRPGFAGHSAAACRKESLSAPSRAVGRATVAHASAEAAAARELGLGHPAGIARARRAASAGSGTTTRAPRRGARARARGRRAAPASRCARPARGAPSCPSSGSTRAGPAGRRAPAGRSGAARRATSTASPPARRRSPPARARPSRPRARTPGRRRRRAASPQAASRADTTPGAAPSASARRFASRPPASASRGWPPPRPPMWPASSLTSSRGVKPLGQVVGLAHEQPGLAVAAPAEHDDAVGDLVQQALRQVAALAGL